MDRCYKKFPINCQHRSNDMGNVQADNLNSWNLGMTLDRIEESWREPVPIQTRLGWTVYGFSNGQNEHHYCDYIYDYSFSHVVQL